MSAADRVPLLSVEGLSVEFRTRGGVVRALERRDLRRPQGRDGGRGGGERVGQVGDVLHAHGHPRPGGAGHRRPRRLRRPRLADGERGRARAAAGPRDLDDLPEPAHRAQPHPARGRADRRRAPPPRGGAAGGGAQARRGLLTRVAIPDPGAALRRLSLRAVGRHLPAGDDRDRARLLARAADRRRADHRPRRHHPGRRHGPDRRAGRGEPHGHAAHHPRPRDGRRALRPHRGDACRARGGDGADRGAVPGARGTRTPRASSRRRRGPASSSATSRPSRAGCPTCAASCRPAATARAASATRPRATTGRCRCPTWAPGHLVACRSPL